MRGLTVPSIDSIMYGGLRNGQLGEKQMVNQNDIHIRSFKIKEQS